MSLFAVHISDGPLSPTACALGFAFAALLLFTALRRMGDEEVPRIALLTAAFFVSSSIRVPIGSTSVHLLLNALVGVILGPRAPLAIAVGLFLQAILLGHGGYSTLGVNTMLIAVPALLADRLFRVLAGPRPSRRRVMAAGAFTGWLTVVITAGLNATVLIVGGLEDWRVVAAALFVSYLGLAVVEGVILGVTAGYLVRVKPELLRLPVRQMGGAATVHEPAAAPGIDRRVTSPRSRTGP
jgi:cobalt/nickel transport system permease protein